MEKRLDDYLERIEKYLKPLPLSERMDIVKEIKSDMLDLQRDGKTVDEIIERLGSPKELAKAYGVMQAPTLIVVRNGEVTRLANASNIRAYAQKRESL